MLTIHQIQRQRPYLRPPTHHRPRRSREHARRDMPTATLAAFHHMLRHMHPGRDQINYLTGLGTNHDRAAHVRAATITRDRQMRERLIRITTLQIIRHSRFYEICHV